MNPSIQVIGVWFLHCQIIQILMGCRRVSDFGYQHSIKPMTAYCLKLSVRFGLTQWANRGTNRTYAGAAVADAALVRTRGAFIAVSQLMSPYRSIRGPDCA